jgi:hypothetical protein
VARAEIPRTKESAVPSDIVNNCTPESCEDDGCAVLVNATASTPKSVYDNGQIITALTTKDGTDPSVAWSTDIDTYSINTGQIDPTHADYTAEMSGYAAMTLAMQAAAREAFALWDEVIGIDLLEVADWPSAHVTFNYSSNTGGASYANNSYWLVDNAPRLEFQRGGHGMGLTGVEHVQSVFDAAYLATYGRLLEGVPVRIMNHRVAVIGRRPKFDMGVFAPVDGRPLPDCLLARREVRIGSATLAAPVYNRLALAVGEIVQGPAILEQPDTTVFVDPGLIGRVDRFGNLIITRKDGI